MRKVMKEKDLAGRALVKSLLIVLLVTGACKERETDRTIERSFYYWRSVFNLNAVEKRALDVLKISKLYVKYFDVVWSEEKKSAMPVAKILFKDEDTGRPTVCKIVPVVFITNECMYKLSQNEIGGLAKNIIQLIEQLDTTKNMASAAEWQIDCDWTATTKENYFLLLKLLKQHTVATQKILSATIRLYQCKYLQKTGVPPVDKGLLMCYNMGNLKNLKTTNSIIETKELEKYTGTLNSYPLALDVALPLFDWKVLFRNKAYAGLIQMLPEQALKNKAVKQTGNYFEIVADTVIKGYAFKQGDVLRDEQSDIQEVLGVCKVIGTQLKTTELAVSLYHLDSITLSKYTLHELEKVFNCLR